LVRVNDTTGVFNHSGLVDSMSNKAGSFYVGTVANRTWLTENIKRGQDYLLQNTRLGIPALVQTEGTLIDPWTPETRLNSCIGIHGFLDPNATIFNSPIGYGCSFNPQVCHHPFFSKTTSNQVQLVEEMATIIGTEASALGVNQLFAPLADLARELRYGRVEETNSEDPYLAGEIAYSYVKGLQKTKVAATVKHFVGFSNPEQGLNTGPVHGGEREMRTT
jgi:beta-glucosidase